MTDNVIPFSAMERARRRQENEDERDAQDLAEDMAALLRQLASQIEDGRLPAEALFVGLVLEKENHSEYPYFFLNLSKLEMIGLLSTFVKELA